MPSGKILLSPSRLKRTKGNSMVALTKTSSCRLVATRVIAPVDVGAPAWRPFLTSFWYNQSRVVRRDCLHMYPTKQASLILLRSVWGALV